MFGQIDLLERTKYPRKGMGGKQNYEQVDPKPFKPLALALLHYVNICA